MNDNNIIDLSDKAYACLTGGQLNEAKSLYTRLCHLDGSNEENWLMLAAVNGEIGSIDEAMDCANKAIELDGAYVEAYLTRAHLQQRQGNNEDAISSALRAVEIDDEYDEAWLFLCGMAGQTGRFDDAEIWARKASSLLPGNTNVLMNLANAQFELSKLDEAEETYGKLLNIQADHFQAQLGLSKVLTIQKKYNDAVELLTQLIKNSPQHSEVLDYLGICYTGLGRVDEAATFFKQIINRDSEYVYVYLHYADLLEQSGDYQEAIKYLHKGKDVSNEPLLFLDNLARLYQEYGMHEKAIESYEEVLKIEPGNFKARFKKVLLLSDMAKYEQALSELVQLEQEFPDDSQIMGTKAGLLERIGEHDQAHEIVLKCLEDEDVSGGVINVYAHLCHRYDECDKVISLMNDILLNPDLEISYRRGLLFTLGKLYDRLGDYDKAFAMINEANELKSYRYDHAEYIHTVDRLIDPRITGLLNEPVSQGEENYSVQPIFIVGMMRSGTSLVEEIIASHPNAFGGGERQEINNLATRLPHMGGMSGEYPECLAELTRAQVKPILEAYKSFVDGLPPGTTVLTDKMPENFHHLVLIRMLFPEARIIHCVRNPVDTCLSCYFQQFAGYHNYAYNLTDLGKHYREYKRLMDHYRDVVKIPMLEVRYEDLVDDTEGWIRKIIDYCGLEWDDRCLRYYESERIVRTASYIQVKEPVYTRSVNRWKNYEKHLEPLIKALGEH